MFGAVGAFEEEQGMRKTKYLVVSGFLGAGKTTSMIAMARSINRRLAAEAVAGKEIGRAHV